MTIQDHPRPPPPALHARCALFLDVDGCLLEFAATPDGVVVPDALTRRLAALCEALDGALALVSGRSVEAIDALFRPLHLPVAGVHGNEMRTRDGMRFQAAPGDAMPRLAADAAVLCARWPGALMEDKGSGFALHWRGAPEAEPALRAFADHALDELPGYRLQPGHSVIELVHDARDKGSAILALLDDAPFRDRVPVFAGDDLTDEPGFAAVNTRGGVSILVGARTGSQARWALPDPTAVRAWLDTFTLEPLA